jgi:hypothetical protein
MGWQGRARGSTAGAGRGRGDELASMALISHVYPDPVRRAGATAAAVDGRGSSIDLGAVLGGLLTMVSWRLFVVGVAALVPLATGARSPRRDAPSARRAGCRGAGKGRAHLRPGWLVTSCTTSLPTSGPWCCNGRGESRRPGEVNVPCAGHPGWSSGRSGRGRGPGPYSPARAGLARGWRQERPAGRMAGLPATNMKQSDSRFSSICPLPCTLRSRVGHG